MAKKATPAPQVDATTENNGLKVLGTKAYKLLQGFLAARNTRKTAEQEEKRLKADLEALMLAKVKAEERVLVPELNTQLSIRTDAVRMKSEIPAGQEYLVAAELQANGLENCTTTRINAEALEAAINSGHPKALELQRRYKISFVRAESINIR